ncbi:hypothetical protein BB560_002210 [Smittium megazygosporum]|uniref:Uncharacterized protein n=1 Tax=Smittium megazygosporum TaxID=133381 RepID=A0A2T9ZFE3_9FUNG|nr:hypothetical protein BB560_002210 [Smittium megazygosporum]
MIGFGLKTAFLCVLSTAVLAGDPYTTDMAMVATTKGHAVVGGRCKEGSYACTGVNQGCYLQCVHGCYMERPCGPGTNIPTHISLMDEYLTIY